VDAPQRRSLSFVVIINKISKRQRGYRSSCVGNTIQELQSNGQSIWCDNISRSMIDTGELSRLIDLGVVGVTSNPTIFMKAITGGSDYDKLFHELMTSGKDLMGIYEGLVVPDIADAADTLRPVYDRTNGVDGYVSLEVSPKLAFDTDATVAEARRLHAQLNRPNVLIKVPATPEGIPAIETLIAEGISVNVTLIFSMARHEKVMQAYISGLVRFNANGGEVSKVSSVASFFISRVDSAIDKLLEDKASDDDRAKGLFGKAAIANARLAYARFEEVFAADGAFGPLAKKGARVQRPLWASTSTKTPSYPSTMYIDGLVGPNTVNTVPPQTIEDMLKGGSSAVTIHDDISGTRATLDTLTQLGIDMDTVTDKLLVDGVDVFAQSFDQLLENLSQKQQQLSTAK
jgi:transaldolase